MSILGKIFGDANEKYLKSIQFLVDEINLLEPECEKLSDNELKEKTPELKSVLGQGQTLDDILPEAFALVREASKRTLGQRHYDVQLIGGIALHQGKIAEMKTGEGKTLVATLPLYLNALEGKGCHLVTINDYLARRDAVWMGQIYNFLGLTVGVLNHEQSFLYDPTYEVKKSEALSTRPTSPASELAGGRAKSETNPNDQNSKHDEARDVLGSFKVEESYLRPCSRKEAYAADITYGTNNEYGFDYLRDNMAYDLGQMVQFRRPNAASGVGAPTEASERGFNFAIVDEVDSILIDEARTPLIISAPDQESSKWYQDFARIIPQLNPQTDYEIDEKLKAATLTEAGINKIEKILNSSNIYEEKGIKYLHHLEQALRAETLFKKDRDYVVKNGEVIIVDEFTGRLMPGRRWSGGLHQAVEAKENVQVRAESLTLASITFQNYFRLYKKLAGMTGTAATSAEEFFKVYNLEVVMIPTNKPNIRKDFPDKVYKTESGKLKAVVKEIKEKHELGQPVLVGTRSVEKNEYLGKLLDIEGIPHQILNAKYHEKEGEIIAQAGRVGQVTIATNMAGRGVDIILGGNPPDNPEQDQRVKELGGLYVIGTERHDARRIDNQLRGRTGRQGDPGASQFFVSLEDDLMRIFGGDRIKKLMGILKIPEDEPIQAGLLSKSLEEAQSKIEGFNFDARRHVLEYDDVLNKHREVIYKKRREMLEGAQEGALKEQILEMIQENGYSKEDYEKREKDLGPDNMRQVERIISLRILDTLWMEHLENMDYLRDSVRLRAYGQQDPLIEYKNEGHRAFQGLLTNYEKMAADTIMKAQISAKPVTSNQQPVTSNKNVGRNDPCPCGSGKKYKKCHGA